MKVVSIIGARPQFIKAAVVSAALRRKGLNEILVHTGQHYDPNMSGIFFTELGLPQPELNLGIGSGPHGEQTGRMLILLEEVLLREKPDWVLVFGDTNSTLAGSLAAAKLGLNLAHVEAGLRSYNREMPEEHNRVLTDRLATLKLCPTRKAVANLAGVGLGRGAHLVGDPMYDAVLIFLEKAVSGSDVLTRLGLEEKGYVLSTIHRPYNTDSPENLTGLLTALMESGRRVVLPVHPRTGNRLDRLDPEFRAALEASPVSLIEPVGYLDMLVLISRAEIVVTDSGGVQREAYFLGVPCLTARPETEWTETVEAGWNLVVGADPAKIRAGLAKSSWPQTEPPPVFGDGRAAEKIAKLLSDGVLPPTVEVE